MNLTKDLTQELEKAESKDRFYQIDGMIERMLAPQHYQRPFTYKKKGWGEIERVELRQEGTPDDLTAPYRRKKVRKGESEVKIADCWTFKTDNGHIKLQWGTNWGLLKKSLRRSLGAQKKLRYDAAPLELVKVYPTWLDTGEAPCESMKGDRVPEVVLETRHTTHGDVMVEVFYDYIEERPFTCIVEVDSEAPIDEQKFVALIKTLNTLDSHGPSRRGELSIKRVARVEVSEDELERMSKGEPVEPVVY